MEPNRARIHFIGGLHYPKSCRGTEISFSGFANCATATDGYFNGTVPLPKSLLSVNLADMKGIELIRNTVALEVSKGWNISIDNIEFI